MRKKTLIFIKIICKVFYMIFYKAEWLFYRFVYKTPKLKIDFIPQRHLILGKGTLDDVAGVYARLFPDRIQRKITQGDLICEHIFDVLGSGPQKLSPKALGYQPIDWHKDFKSGYSWNSKVFYRDICFGNIKGVDIKVPWELSRFQHLNVLGQAYILTKNKKYSEEFTNQITDWIQNNPVGFGVNWRCAMDVAIRAANWLVAMEYFSENNLFPKNFIRKFYTSIYEHAKFIYNHLEHSFNFKTNHYLADITGLFFIAVYCPFFKESKKWQNFALKELCKEIEKQIYDDGCNFEASTSYHRLALEMFFYADLLGKRVGIEFPQSYRDRLRKVFESSLYCIKPNGLIPQIGDNDNGRFLVFSQRPMLEHKYLLNLAAIHYKDSQFKVSNFDFDEDSFWLFGKAGESIYSELIFRKKLGVLKEFSNAGWYIIRCNNDYCFISCGPNGQKGHGGHAHNDKLSFDLVLDGQDVIVDPGTYVYTPYPKERNKFRSTEYHNTVKFNGYEQNEILERNIFNLPDRVKIKKAFLKEAKQEVGFEGEIQYLNCAHERMISLDKEFGNWQITDKISCAQEVEAKLIFHLSPDVFFDNGYILSRKTGGRIASIEIEGNRFNKATYDYSPEYGVKIKAEYVTADIPVAKDKRIITTIRRVK